jgi:hypothetical protein
MMEIDPDRLVIYGCEVKAIFFQGSLFGEWAVVVLEVVIPVGLKCADMR